MTLEATPEEMLKYATKFEFPPTKHMRLSVEKCKDRDDELIVFRPVLLGGIRT